MTAVLKKKKGGGLCGRGTEAFANSHIAGLLSWSLIEFPHL